IPPQITIITQDFNPISLLKYFDKVYTKTSQMGFEALMMGCECVTYGMPFYAGWGLTIDKQTCPRRTRKLSLEELFAGAYILYCHYYNPIYQRKSDIFDTLKTIKKYSYQSSSKKAFMFGFSFWKHHFIFGYSQKKPNFIQPFLQEFDPKNIIFIHPVFCDPLSLALKKGLNADCEIFIWGRKTFDSIESFAKANTIKLVRVEDGFIRSLSLGSDLTRPFSLVFDDMGIYFDPNTPSRLENILENTTFTADLLEEASCLKKQILTSKISKYNIHKHATLNLPKDKTILLVIGQVEDDASILFGARGRGNQSLLEQVRHENPKAYILYKPHPDVLSGNRLGHIKTQIALQYCDKIIENISLHSAIQASHEIHTLTSLSGLEALMYGKKVVTYGMPFYAGWGLTIDKQTCPRRTRKLSLEELIAGVYLLYPRYIHPKTLQYCCAEVLIKCLQQDQKKLHESISETFKNKIYTFFSRKIQKLFRKIL
ncbi:MAG: capsular polysaccharide biosynthesis protein, partial [Helicobacter sp.]|nr:capsular polysaccharide biosynthesis protein [Helicobacter sp.]